MDFYFGQKVVCVNAPPFGGRLRKGGVYTVCGWSENVTGNPDGSRSRGVLLKELPPIRLMDGKPNGFWHERSRPAVERKTDISIFTAMLNPSDERVMS